jgi:hypothetical protein
MPFYRIGGALVGFPLALFRIDVRRAVVEDSTLT